VIASATGVLGSNRHYLEQVATQLEKLGIEDPYVQNLAEQVQRIDGP